MTKFRMVVAVSVAALLALPVYADAIPSGEYSWQGDGATITMTVDGSKIGFVTAGEGCAGAGNGETVQLAQNEWIAVLRDSALSCEIHVTKKGHQYTIEEQKGCGDFHGFSCDFNAHVRRSK